MSSTDPTYVGRLALMALNGALEPVVVTHAVEQRLTVTKGDGETLSVALGRLYWMGQTAVTDPADLATVWATLEAAQDGCDLDAAWAATTDADVQPACERLAEAAFGRTDPTTCDAIPIAIFRDSQRFRVRGRRLQRFTAAEVEATLTAAADAAHTKRMTELAHSVVAAHLAGTRVDDPDADAAYVEAVRALTSIAVHGEDKAMPADVAAVATLLTALEQPKGAAFELLVALGEMGAHENLAVRRSGFPTTFSEEVRVAAKSAASATSPTVSSKVRDLRHLTTVAIDDALTTEVDDAFAIEGSRLYVLIADVAAYVQPSDPIDVAASQRVSTIYLPEGTVPMLPREIGEDAASLCAGLDRTAMAFSFEVTDDGRLTGVEMTRALVCVDRQLTYEAADTYLASTDAGAEGASLATLLQTARTWMDAHRSGRASRGAVFFQRNEVYMHVEADGRVVRRVGDPYAPARQLVSELMIATCRAVAEVCAEQAIPCIYRTQAAPDTAGTAFAAHPAGAPIVGAAAQMGLLRQLKPAVLSTKPKLHFTLGVGAYTQLSSPIRRYGDLLMHQQLTSLLKTGRPRFSAGQLMAHFDAIEKTTGQIRRVELESKRYWAAVYLAERRDETFAAQVVREHGRRWLVEVSDLALMLPADLRRGVHSGDWVDVSVVKADARAGKILLKHV